MLPLMEPKFRLTTFIILTDETKREMYSQPPEVFHNPQTLIRLQLYIKEICLNNTKLFPINLAEGICTDAVWYESLEGRREG